MMPPLPPAPPPDDSASPPLPPGALTEEQGRCANCLTPLAGPFCWRCGQHVADYHRSVWRFVVDFFDSAFCWDNKLLRTLGPLLQRPGWLTQEFMAGRRVRYVHPLRLFLFTSAICLALLQWTHSSGLKVRVGKLNAGKKPVAVAMHLDDSKDDEDEDRQTPVPTVAPVPSASPAPATPPPADAAPAASPARSEGDSLSSILHDTFKQGANKAGKTDQARDAAPDRRWEALSDDLQRKIDAAGGVERFNERVTNNVQSKLSWVALAMLPIFALFMRMAFGRAGGYYFTYLVFSLHYHTFLLMFWVAYSWVNAFANFLHSDLLQIVTALSLLVPPWYLFRALRQMYGQGWSVTGAKVFVIASVHLLTLFIGLAMIGATAFL